MSVLVLLGKNTQMSTDLAKIAYIPWDLMIQGTQNFSLPHGVFCGGVGNLKKELNVKKWIALMHMI